MMYELTKEEEQKIFAQYIRTWTDIVLSTEPCDFENATKWSKEVYKAAGLDEPEHFFHFASPIDAAYGIGNLMMMYEKKKRITRHNLLCILGDMIDGNMQGYELSVYHFFYHVLKRNAVKECMPLCELAKYTGWWSPYENTCVFQDRPLSINVNHQGQLHKDGGPSIEYRAGEYTPEGYKLYHLNGIEVPDWMAVTPAEHMDAKRFFDIVNVDMRREFVRKVGTEILCHKLGAKEIDKESFQCDTGEHRYTLLKMPANKRGGLWTYLKMENASIPELYHVEGVSNDAKTVREALNFRNQLRESDIDDKNGAEWYQQGDVILRPSNAKKFKRFPQILT